MRDPGFGPGGPGGLGPTGWDDPLGGPEWGWGPNGSPFGSGNNNGGSSGGSGGGCGCSLLTILIAAVVLGQIIMGIMFLLIKLGVR